MSAREVTAVETILKRKKSLQPLRNRQMSFNFLLFSFFIFIDSLIFYIIGNCPKTVIDVLLKERRAGNKR